MPMSAPASRPTSLDPLMALADRCVQCGLCLPTCPTYASDRIEAESPRGRIALARAIASATLIPGVIGERHLDHCLACGNCEAVCPSRVEFGALLVHARTAQRVRRAPDWRQRIVEALVARRYVLNALLATYRVLSPLWPGVSRPLPPPPSPMQAPGRTPVAPARRTWPQVALFTGCVSHTYETHVRASLRVLCDALEVDVVEPVGQACCGALHAHAGDTRTATALAARNHRALGNCDVVLTLATGCHGTVAGALGAVRTQDALTWLAERADSLTFRSHPRRIGVHVPCTQRNVSRSAGAMHALLARIEGVELVRLDVGFGCCGASGTHMLTDRARADRFRSPLLAQARAAHVDAIASANIGCRLHLANGADRPVLHPLELLATTLVPQAALMRPTVDSMP